MQPTLGPHLSAQAMCTTAVLYSPHSQEQIPIQTVPRATLPKLLREKDRCKTQRRGQGRRDPLEIFRRFKQEKKKGTYFAPCVDLQRESRKKHFLGFRLKFVRIMLFVRVGTYYCTWYLLTNQIHPECGQ